MSGLLRSEWIKLTTVRTTWWLAVALVGLLLLSTLLPLLVSPTGTPPPVDDPTLQIAVLHAGSQAGTFALILGIIGAAGEYRQSMITPTLLATPRRGEVVAGKSLVYGFAGLLLGVLAFAVAAIVLAAVAGPASLGIPAGDVARVVGGGLAFCLLSGVLGVGLGFLIRSQVGALSVALVLVLVAEPIVQAFAPGVGRWLMGVSGQALAGVEATVRVVPADAQAPTVRYLSQGVGGAVFLGYVALASAIGSWRLRRQDVG